MRHAALEKGILLTIARSEQSHRAAIRAEPVEMLILSVKSGRQKPINRKSQNVFDFIELNGSLCAQAIEIIEYRNLDYSHELYGYPYLCPACDHAKVTALQQHYHMERADG